MTPLQWYIIEEKGDSKIVDQLIDNGADVNCFCFKNGTPLAEAILRGYFDITARLLFHGADVLAKISHHHYILHEAIICDNYEVTELIVNEIRKKGKEHINCKDTDGNTPLMWCAEDRNRWHENSFVSYGKDDKETAELLLAAGAIVDRQNNAGITPLVNALTKGRLNVSSFLLDQGADILLEHLDKTILHFAVISENMLIIDLILDRLKDRGLNIINRRDSNGLTPLQWYIINGKGDSRIVDQLIHHGADVNWFCFNNGTALSYAIVKGHFDITSRLLFHGADILAKIFNHHYILHEAIVCGSYEITEIVVHEIREKGQEHINCKDNEGNTPLMWCAEDRNKWHEKSFVPYRKSGKETAELLLAAGADVNSQNNEGLTPLTNALSKGRLDVLSVLLKHGADILLEHLDKSILHFALISENRVIVELILNRLKDIGGNFIDRRNSNGLTPLQSYIIKGNGDSGIVDQLINNGADVNYFSLENGTALAYAISMGHANIASRLIFHGADVLAKISNHHYILHQAIRCDNYELTEMIVNKVREKEEENINCKDNEGDTPLMWCAENGDKWYENAKLLLESGADVTVQNNEGKTALDWALERRDPKMIDLMLKAIDDWAQK